MKPNFDAARAFQVLRLSFLLVLLLLVATCSDQPASEERAKARPVEPVRATEAADEPVDPAIVASVRGEITTIKTQIAEAESESARYSGGLVKTLIESRIQTLKQTLAMLEQRDKAWAFRLPVSYMVDGKAFSLPAEAKAQLPDLEREIRELGVQIESQEQEVARYSGGLVRSLGLSTLATMKQTEAMLDQRRLAIRYELPQYLAFQKPESPSTEASTLPVSLPIPSAASPEARSDDWEIVSVASRPGESNSSWTRFSWKLTLRNRSSQPQRFDGTIEFRDSDGFPVDSDNEYNMVVPAGTERTFTGEKLINATQVGRIATTAAKVNKD